MYQLVALRVPKRQNLRKLGNFKKILEMLGLDDKYQLSTQKPNFDFFGKKSQKSSVNQSIEKPVFPYFVNLSPIFCPRL